MEGYDASTYGERMADVYDEWYPFDPDTPAAVDRLAALAGPPPARILELGAGTGRLAVPLAGLGHDVVALDTSPAMLERLAAKPGGERVRAVVGDMADDVPAGPFALVVVAVNTLFNLDDPARLRACLAAVAAALADAGRLVVEAFVPADPPPTGASLEVRSMTADRVVLSVSRSDPADQVAEGQFVELRDGAPVRLRPWRIRWATPAQLDDSAADAGLVLVERWAGWRAEPFDDTSSHHVSVYRRRR